MNEIENDDDDDNKQTGDYLWSLALSLGNEQIL